MLTTTISQTLRANLISDSCPACRAPMVGTKPIRACGAGSQH